jgi:tetratricopeptide (TPR) repeat protein
MTKFPPAEPRLNGEPDAGEFQLQFFRAFRQDVGMAVNAAEAHPVRKWYATLASSRLWPGVLLVLLIFLAYLPALRCGFIWDDDDYVTQNPLLTAPDGFRRIWFSLDSPSQYFPLTYTTFRLEYSLWGLNPFGFHLDNILLHAANGWLVWRLLRRLRVPGAWLGAALFALHPVQVESVAWVTERKNVLSLFFFLLALLAWIESALDRPRPAWRWYGLSLAFYALALCAKSTACTLPAALLLILWLKEKPINAARLLQIVPFVMLGAGMGLLTMWWERYHQHTEGWVYGLGWLDRLLLASHAVWFYAGKLVWPAKLTFSYPRWTIDGGNPMAYGWLAAGCGLCIVIYCLRRFAGRNLEVAVAFYVATLVPLLGFIMLATFQYSFVADHYQYVASIGPLSLAAAGIAIALGPFRERKPFLKPVLAGILLLALGVLTWRQAGIYRDGETLWRDTLAKNPGSWMAHDNLGFALLESGRLEDAMAQFRQAIELNPERVTPHNNLASALRECGRLDEAESELRKALELAPGVLKIHFNWVKLLEQEKRLNEEVEEYKVILRMLPPSDKDRIRVINTLLADALCKLGRVDEAIPCYREALQLDPTGTAVRIQLGRALIDDGDFAAAQLEFSSVLHADARNAKAIDGLGYLLAMQGKADEAKARYLEAMQLDPKDASTYLHYALLLSSQQQFREAVVEYRKALALDDRLLIACNNLAWMLASSPDPQIRDGREAVELAERACRLTNNEQPFFLGTLAAAYAEAGRFNDAVATAEKARDLARKNGLEKIAERNGQLLELYQVGQPYHEPAVGH